MDIRTLTVADASAYWRLRLEALQKEPRAFGQAAEEHQTTTVEQAAARIGNMPPQNFILGGFVDPNLIAIATFIRETGLKERHKGHIYGVYVTASHRGKGLGRELMHSLLNKAKGDASLEQILLAVATCLKSATRLYRELGFEAYGIEPRAFKIASEYVDEARMVLRIR